MSVRTLILIVACCGAIFWSAHFIRDTLDPTVPIARALRTGVVASRRQAAEQLGQVGPSRVGFAIAALAAALADEDEEVRFHAASGLRFLVLSPAAALLDPAAPAAAVAALSAALEDPSVRVRAKSLEALVAMARAARVAPPPSLLDGLSHARPASFRAQIATALPAFHLGRVEVVARLAEALGDDDAGVICAAASSLGQIGEDAGPALPALITLMNRPDPRAGLDRTGRDDGGPAEAAALAIGMISASDRTPLTGIAALQDALRSGSEPRRAAASQALWKAGRRASSAAPALMATLATGSVIAGGSGYESWAARALGRAAPGSEWAGRTIRALTDGLDARSEGTRGYCAEALGEFGPAASAALPRLRAMRASSQNFDAWAAGHAIKRIEAAPAPAASAPSS